MFGLQSITTVIALEGQWESEVALSGLSLRSQLLSPLLGARADIDRTSGLSAAAEQHEDDFGTLHSPTNVSDPALPAALENVADRDFGPIAHSFASQLPKVEILKPYSHDFDASATKDAASKTPTQSGFANAGAVALAALEVNGHAPAGDTAPADQASAWLQFTGNRIIRDARRR